MVVTLMSDDHEFARDVLNASLTLISIFVAVIVFLAVEYKDARSYAPTGEPIRNAIEVTTLLSGYTGILALIALVLLRSGRGRTAFLPWALALLIAGLTLGILYVGFSLLA